MGRFQTDAWKCYLKTCVNAEQVYEFLKSLYINPIILSN